MRDILARVNRAALSHFAACHVLVALDFDGTLAPISADRDAVRMRPRTAEVLRALTDCYPCAIVSGRSTADVVCRLEGAPIPHIIGNHGLEPFGNPHSCEAWVGQALPILERALARMQGIDIENKRYSISVHYRHAPYKTRALRAVAMAAERLPERPRLIGGKMVVNVLPAGAPHKGIALAALARREGFAHVIYVGDDETDEDVFGGATPGALLGIRVGRRQSSAAQYFVRDQEHVDDLLCALVEERARSRAHGA